jgi:hypothetical protein
MRCLFVILSKENRYVYLQRRWDAESKVSNAKKS